MLGSSGENAASEASEPSTVCSSPVTRPSARTCSSSPSGRAQPVEHELPAVLRARQVLLQDAERRVQPAALEVVPAGERRDVREPARGQEAQQLQLGVLARLDAPERLQDQLVAEHDEELDCSTPTGRTSTVPPREDDAEGAQWNPSSPVLERSPRSPGACGAAARARRRGRPGRRRPSSPPPCRSRARPSPPRRAAARAAPDRSRASPPGRRPPSGRAPAAATPSAAAPTRRR